MNIVGKLVTLRAFEENDVELLNKWSNEPELWKMLGGWHFPYSLRSTKGWISQINDNNHTNHVFAIDNNEGKLIGTANLVNIDWKNRNAFHGMMLGDKNTRGTGLALDTVMAIMRYAFDELGLNRLDGDMIATNSASINFYIKRCGWEIEGKKLNWFYRSGTYHDKIIVGITKERYQSWVAETGYWEQPL